jgi:carboxymethylenebutenolidase
MAIERTTVAVEGEAMPLTIARGGGSGAAVVIAPSAFGVADDLVEQMDEMARDATVVITFDPFFRGDTGPVPYDDMPRARGRLTALDRAQTALDLRAAIALARAEAPVVVLGICFGGPFALLAAADGLVDGVVTWHGTRMELFLKRAAEMRCPMRLHFGEADLFVPPEAVDLVRRAFADRRDVEIVVHEGATHGFTHRATARAHGSRAEQAAMRAVRELVTTVA